MTGTNWMTGAIGVVAIAALGLGLYGLRDTDTTAPAAPVEGASDPVSDLDREILQAEMRRYLLENPEIIMELVSVLESRQTADAQAVEQQMLRENADQLLDDGYSFVGGNPEGDVTLVEFLDYQCSFCKRAHPEVASLLAQDGNIRLIVKEFPILGPVSETASRAAMAVLLEQGPDLYETFNDAMMMFPGRLDDAMIDRLAERSGVDVAAMHARMDDSDITRQIAQNKQLAEQLQITGTPTFVLGDTMIRGYLPAEQMADAVRLTRSAMR